VARISRRQRRSGGTDTAPDVDAVRARFTDYPSDGVVVVVDRHDVT